MGPGESERRRQGDRRIGQALVHARAACLASVIDHLLQPVLLVAVGDDGSLQVWLANTAAQHVLSAGGPLRFDGEDLRCHDDVSGRDLRQAALRARRRGVGHVETVQLEMGGDEPCMVELHLEAIDPDAGTDAPDARLLLVEVLEWLSPERAMRSLCRDYALTAAEAQMVLHLHARGSAVQLARETGKSIHTVRSQLKAAMQKTGVRTQAGLVALAGNCLAVRAPSAITQLGDERDMP